MAWFTAGSGATCVAAYDAVGASSLADSYVNEANPGTYTAAPGVAPTWAYGTGWTFNGTTQYLTTGYTPAAANTGSVLVRFSNRTNNGFLIAGNFGGADIYGIWMNAGGARFGNGGILISALTPTSGVIGYAGLDAYLNGADVGNLASGGAAAAQYTIGRYPFGLYIAASIQAVAIYSGTLTLADVVAITAAMNALPAAASSAVAKILQAHGAYMGAR